MLLLHAMLHTQRSLNLVNPFMHPNLPLFRATQKRPLVIYRNLFSICKKPEHLQQIHARFILHGLHHNPTLCSNLIDSYANLGLFHISKRIFSSIIDPSIVLYNSIMRSFTIFGEFESSLVTYQEMLSKSLYPDDETYPSVLKSCSCLSDVYYGKRVHGHVIKLGFESFSWVDSALVEMYKSFDEIDEEVELVDRKCSPSLNYSISSLSEGPENGNLKGSSKLCEKIGVEKVELDCACFINLLRFCVDLGWLRFGKEIHCVAVVSGLVKDLSLNTALLSMYSKLGALGDARLLFEKMHERDCVVWNIMISAYRQKGYPEKSMELLRYMVNSGIRADLFTAIPAVSSIRQLKSIKLGKEMHAGIIRNGLDYQVSVHNALIDMYCECDCLSYARRIFDLLANKTVISWSSMIKGYANHELSLEALSLFSEMKLSGVKVDFITVINVLPACVNVGALELVNYIHGFSTKFGLNMLSPINSALLVSYAKCGCIEMARKLFDEEEVNTKDIITWNSIITAYAKHGDWSGSFDLCKKMKESNLKPDEITFLGLLIACVNSGLVEEGRQLFKEMIEIYACKPSQEHYACMVDLLGRAGHVNEAWELVQSMPCKPDARVWGPLLNACKRHTETGFAEFAAEKLVHMEPRNAGNYILLSNMYAAAGKWDGVARMRSYLRDKGLKKTPGCSWLEINGQVHEFRVAERSHPKVDDIYTILKNLQLEIKEVRHHF